jgi:hypothetical protein
VEGLDNLADVVETELVRHRVNGVPEPYPDARERAEYYRHERPEVLRAVGDITAREVVGVVWDMQALTLEHRLARV